MSESNVFLLMEDISKAFPGVQALDHARLEVIEGEIHALMGENGAGKSTLMKILTGAIQKDSGRILLRGQEVDIRTPAQALGSGISMIHQELALVPYRTVGENIFLGREPRRKLPWLIDWKTLYLRAQDILDQLNVGVDARTNVDDLSIAQQQMVEVAKALSYNADLIIMDEPTSSLTDRETEVLFDLMRSLREKRVSIIFISHRLEEVFEIADRVTVLRDGKYIGTRLTSETDENEIIRMMVGRDLGEMFPKTETERRGVILEARNLSDGRELYDASFKLYGGEVLGIAGLVGAGRTALAETVFGIRKATEGDILLDGKRAHLNSANDAIRLGMGLVPEDRKQQGLFLNMAVRENITISAISQVSKVGFLDFKKMNELTKAFIQKLDIRTPSLMQKVRNLSGGNQQKVVISRWLTLNPRVLILDEPTRGIDIGAKSEIHGLMSQLASEGVGVMMISSELPEVLGVSDRILVMHEGHIVAEFSREEATQDNIMLAATGMTGRNEHA